MDFCKGKYWRVVIIIGNIFSLKHKKCCFHYLILSNLLSNYRAENAYSFKESNIKLVFGKTAYLQIKFKVYGNSESLRSSFCLKVGVFFE